MFKFNPNILKIKLLYLNFLGKISKNNFKINTSHSISNINSVLIVFPIEEQDFNVAKYSFRDLLSKNNIDCVFLINNIFYNTTRFSGETYGLNYIKKKNKITLNENFNTENIINKEFDVVIDLNCNFILDIAMIINKLKSNYKVGFKSQYSDLFYNIQFEYDTLEGCYSKINSMLS